jgi:hypothetical protein
MYIETVSAHGKGSPRISQIIFTANEPNDN